MKQIAATVKKLRQLARFCDQQAAMEQWVTERTHRASDQRNEKIWRGRSRTCWKAINLLVPQRKAEP